MALLVSCQSTRIKPPPQGTTRTPAKEQPSAVPSIEEARRFASEADLKGTEARAGLSEAKSGMEHYRSRVMSLTDLVRKLQEQGSAAATDLKKLYDELAQQDAFIEQLIAKIDRVQQSLAAERDLRAKVDEKLVETQNRLVAKEMEAQQLRVQLADAEKDAAQAQLSAQQNFKAAQDANSAADRVRGEKRVIFRILIGVSVLALVSLLVNYVQFRGGRLPL
jgi:chromosome segregation ATPase